MEKSGGLQSSQILFLAILVDVVLTFSFNFELGFYMSIFLGILYIFREGVKRGVLKSKILVKSSHIHALLYPSCFLSVIFFGFAFVVLEHSGPGIDFLGFVNLAILFSLTIVFLVAVNRENI